MEEKYTMNSAEIIEKEKDIIDSAEILGKAKDDLEAWVRNDSRLEIQSISYMLRMATVNAALASRAQTQWKIGKTNNKLMDTAIWLLMSMNVDADVEYSKGGNPAKLIDEMISIISGCTLEWARHSHYQNELVWDVLLAILIEVGPEEFPKLLRERWAAEKWL